MKVLVTGSDGLLGSNLVRRLIERGDAVRAMVHPKSNSTTLEGLDVEQVAGDVLDAESMLEASRDCEGVFHVAASTAQWPPRAPIITQINVRGTRNVLAAARREGVRRFVHVGSASSFGFGTKENPGTEKTPYCYGRSGLAYFESKLKAQKLVLKEAEEGRVDAVVVNPTFMFGPYDSAPSSGKMIVKIAKMQPPAYPSGGRCFAHARDVADGMIGAMEKGKTGECYILGNQNLSMKELIEIISEVAGTRPPKFQIPESLIKLVGRAGSLYGAVTGKPPELSYEMAKGSCTGSYYSPEKAVRELGLPQTPVVEAVEDAYRWLSDNGYCGRDKTRSRREIK